MNVFSILVVINQPPFSSRNESEKHPPKFNREKQKHSLNHQSHKKYEILLIELFVINMYWEK